MILAITLFAALMAADPPHVQAVQDVTPKPPAATQESPATPMVLSATPPPTPSLRYRLSPSYGQQTPGNAAPLYLIAFELAHSDRDVDVKVSDLLTAPPDHFAKDDARNLVQRFSGSLNQVAVASRREYCRWDLPFREEGPATLLPHLNPARELANVLALRARLEIAEHRYDDALNTLQIGFTLASHIQRGGVLVQALVGAGIDDLMLDRLAELEQADGSPNVYWTLANLPPLFDRQSVFDIEQSWPQITFPELRGRPIEQLSTEELSVVYRHLLPLWEEMRRNDNNPLDYIAMMIAQYPAARQSLLTAGRSEQEVDAMPPEAVLTLYLFQQYAKISDAVYRWAAMPYWQARPGMERAIRQNDSNALLRANPLMIMMPAFNRAELVFGQRERFKAMLQCIAGLQAYAAAHDGKLPNALTDMSDTPAPLDPLTGEAFDYRRDGDKTATLQARLVGPTSSGPAREKRSFRITIR